MGCFFTFPALAGAGSLLRQQQLFAFPIYFYLDVFFRYLDFAFLFQELPAERLSAAPGFSSLRISSRNQAGQADARRQAAPVFGASPHATVDTAESLQPPVSFIFIFPMWTFFM